MDDRIPARLETPQLRLGGLRLWVHGRQFPQAQDYWDGNWLNVTAQCDAPGSSVAATGPILHLSELAKWCTDTRALLETLTGEAKLACLEPYLDVTLKAGSLGHISIEVSITPDHMEQRHWFSFSLDQSHLPPFIAQCQAILRDHPVRGSDHQD